MRKYFILLALVLGGCASKSGNHSDDLVSIQILDRNGFSETISARERLGIYENIHFNSPQPYQKVVRIYGKASQGNTFSKVTTYHPNGQPWQYLEIENGRAHGQFIEWHPNGQQKIEATVIGHLHSQLILRTGCILAGMPAIHFLGATFRRNSTALNEAKLWRPFRVQLCPSLTGIQLLKDGGWLTVELSADARQPARIRFHPLPWSDVKPFSG